MKSINFLALNGTPHQIISHFNPNGLSHYEDFFLGHSFDLHDVFDLCMDRLVQEDQVKECDKPWMLSYLLAAKDLVGPQERLSSLFYKFAHYGWLAENFESTLDAARFLQVMDYVGYYAPKMCNMGRDYGLSAHDKSKLTSTLFDRTPYMVALPDDISLEIFGIRTEPGVRIIVEQLRCHLSCNFGGSTYSYLWDRFVNAKGDKVNTDSGWGMSLPCCVTVVPNGPVADRLRQRGSSEVSIPVDWIVSELYYEGPSRHTENWKERPVNNVVSNGAEVVVVNTKDMKHHQIAKQQSKKVDKWIDLYNAHEFADDLHQLLPFEQAGFMNAVDALKRFKGPTLVEALRRIRPHLACLLTLPLSKRTEDLAAICYSHHDRNGGLEILNLVAPEVDAQKMFEQVRYELVPDAFINNKIGEQAEKYRTSLSIDEVFRAPAKVFSDEYLVKFIGDRKHTFEKIKHIPGHLVSPSVMVALMKKNGFDPDQIGFDFKGYLNFRDVYESAIKIRPVKKWMAGNGCIGDIKP